MYFPLHVVKGISIHKHSGFSVESQLTGCFCPPFLFSVHHTESCNAHLPSKSNRVTYTAQGDKR